MASSVITRMLIIEGMTCVSCENRIQKKLLSTAGIISAKVSYVEGKATISYDEEIISFGQIETIIEELDYYVKKQILKENEKSKFDPINMIGVIAILTALYMLMNHFNGLGIFNAFPIAKEGMGYGMLFVIGVLTSVHCVAMCGGICLSQCVPKTNENEKQKSKLATLRPSLLYNAGRVVSYTVFGGVVGAIGSVVSFSGTLKGIVQIVAGIFMVIMGLNMLGIFPWLRKLNPRMPRIFADKINSGKKSNHAFYIGLLNGLMPCGPLQAMQLYALSTGSPVKGAIAMFLFSIGTVPLMFGFGVLSSYLNKKFTKKMMTVSAALVVLLGVSMFSNGTSLSGITFPSFGGSSTITANAAIIEDGNQTITTTLSSGRYEPITVQKGIPVKWTIEADESNINGCNYSIVIPEYGIQVDLEPGKNVIEFTPEESGSVPFSCWMGMIRSSISVVDDISNIGDEATESGATSVPDAGSSYGIGGGCCGVGGGSTSSSSDSSSRNTDSDISTVPNINSSASSGFPSCH